MSIKIKDKAEMANVATIAANNDRAIAICSPTPWKSWQGWVVTVDEGKSLHDELEHVEGMQFDRGYLSPYFVTDSHHHGSCSRRRLHSRLREEGIEHQGFGSCFGASCQQGKPLLIIAEDVDGEALATLVINRLRGTLNVAAVKAPGYGDRRKGMMEDIVSSPCQSCFSKHWDCRLDSLTLADLGRAKKIIIDKDNTTIIEGAGKSFRNQRTYRSDPS